MFIDFDFSPIYKADSGGSWTVPFEQCGSFCLFVCVEGFSGPVSMSSRLQGDEAFGKENRTDEMKPKKKKKKNTAHPYRTCCKHSRPLPFLAGRGSLIGSVSVWHASGPWVRSSFFRGDLVMKKFPWQFSLFRWFKKSSCQLLAKECALSTGKLPRRLAQEQCG